MMGIDDIFISFVTSYISGELLSFKESFFQRKKNMTIQEHIEKCYERALKKWIANDIVKERIARAKFFSVNQLRELYKTNKCQNDSFAIKIIINLWKEELCKDEVCAHYIQEHGLKVINNKIDQLIEIINNKEANHSVHDIHRGLIRHNPVNGYIRRYCSSDSSGSDLISTIIGKKERHILADYVVGIEDSLTNKFILYSSAQTGKTTELKELCWELQQSGIFMPISFEVRNNTKLKRTDLPIYKYLDNKEIVIIIDALDEVNGQIYDDLIEEIDGYAYDHPDIKIVLSCRSNYRRGNILKQFKELFLNELSFYDAKEYIDRILGKGNGLIGYITNNQLFEFVKNPFFLNILVDSYRNGDRNLPKTKADIYHLFIERSYKIEIDEKNKSFAVKHNFAESLILLERIALGLSLMNVQTLSEKELQLCLYDKIENLEECKRFDLIRCEEGKYSFKHNAFREWLVANYLKREGIEKAKQLASHPNGRIKLEWYNIIILWISMYDNKREEEIKAILCWLKEACLELVIYIDRDMLDEKTRSEVFKGVLLEYKSLGIRMSNITTQDYKNLLLFGQSEEIVNFMIDEITEAIPGTAYYFDLMCLCYFLDWVILKISNKELSEKLFETLENKTREVLTCGTSNSLSYIYVDNDFFIDNDYFERIFELFRLSNNYEVIKMMIKLISKADKVDEYVDYILDKEKYIHNQQEGITTHIVSRSEVYESLSKLKSANSIKKILCHQFYSSFYHDEQNQYISMMEKLLMNVSLFIKQGDDELINILEDNYLSVFKDYHYQFNNDEQMQKLLSLYRKCYQESGLIERGRNIFNDKLNILFSQQNQESYTRQDWDNTFHMAALWMTVDDVKADFNKFQINNGIDSLKANWYMEIPYVEVSEFARKMYNEKFEPSKIITQGQIRRKKAFEDFADYKVFKQNVLEMVSDIDDQITSKEYNKRLRNREEGYNQYTFRFILQHVDNEDRYDKKAIIRNIKNQSFYEAFFMYQIANLMISGDFDQLVTDKEKERCLSCAKNTVLELCQGRREVYYAETALKLMLNGYFDISTEFLPGLVEYGYIHISKKSKDDYFSKEYTLFEYITENVSLATLSPIVIDKMKENIDNKNYQLLYAFSNYIIDNHLEEGYNYVFCVAISGFYMSSNILEKLIKERIKIDELKYVIEKINISDRLLCYSSFIKNLGYNDWVKNKLESEFIKFKDYELKQAVKLLISIGSIKALSYLHSNLNFMNDEFDLHFNYDDTNSVPSLCFVLKYYVDNNIESSPFVLNSIITSLEKISLKNNDSLFYVKSYLQQLTQKGEQYNFLNRYIIAFEDKYYTAYSGINDINKVINLIDSNIQDNTKVKLESDNNQKYYTYISYNWESESSHVVDFLGFVLESKGIQYGRDKKDCCYKDNIKCFMNAIRKGNKVIVVFSKKYLMSKNCMYELSGIIENPNFKERLLPVVVDDTIRDDLFYVDLVRFWKEKLDNQEYIIQQLSKIDPNKVGPEEEKLQEIKDVYKLLDEIKKYIDWTNVDNLDALCATHFDVIINEILHDTKHYKL